MSDRYLVLGTAPVGLPVAPGSIRMGINFALDSYLALDPYYLVPDRYLVLGINFALDSYLA